MKNQKINFLEVQALANGCTSEELIARAVQMGQSHNSHLPNDKHLLFVLLQIADEYPDIWVTRGVAAYLLGLSKGTLEIWASQGKGIVYEKSSRLARYRIGDIKKHIQISTIK